MDKVGVIFRMKKCLFKVRGSMKRDVYMHVQL